jgi:carbon storage regulator
MLVLTRKLKESITIGNDVEIEVLEIRAGKVKLGFKAPHNVKIVRSETQGNTDTPPIDPAPANQ